MWILSDFIINKEKPTLKSGTKYRQSEFRSLFRKKKTVPVNHRIPVDDCRYRAYDTFYDSEIDCI